MKARLTSLILVLLAAGLPGSARGQRADARLDQTRVQVRQLEELHTGLEARARALRDQVAELAARIAELKQKKRSIRENMQLNSLLGESRERAQALTAIDRRVRAAHQALERVRRQLVQQLELEIEALGQDLSRTPVDREVARRNLRNLARLREERAEILASEASTPLPALPRIEADPLDGPTELQAKSDFLRDSADKLRRAAAQLAARMSALVRDRALARAAREFIEEHALFDEEERALSMTRTALAEARTGDTSGKHGEAEAPGEPTGNASADNDEDRDGGWGYDDIDGAADLDEGADPSPGTGFSGDDHIGGGGGSDDAVVVRDGGGAAAVLSGARSGVEGGSEGLAGGLAPEEVLQRLEQARARMLEQARALESQAQSLERQAGEIEE